MSTRSQVHFKNSGVYLYQHYDGNTLSQRVQWAIKKNARWDDEEYLTRIVFDGMKSEQETTMYVRYNEEPTTGFGIGTTRHSDIEYLVSIDCEKQTIEIESGYGKDMTIDWTGSFEEFSNLGYGAMEELKK